MKEIDSQLYGYSYELDTTSESDGTKCFAVDTGTVFVAYKGVWYEQPGSFWAASISEGEDDLFGLSWEIGKIVPAEDLLVLNAVDTGARYVSFNGKWYEQPVAWSAPAAGGGADPFIVTFTPTAQDLSGTMDKTVAEINAAYEAGQKIVFRVYSSATVFNEVEVTIVYKNGSYTYPSFNAYLVVTAASAGFDGIVFAYTGTTNDGTKSTYATTIYPLTPAGGSSGSSVGSDEVPVP